MSKNDKIDKLAKEGKLSYRDVLEVLLLLMKSLRRKNFEKYFGKFDSLQKVNLEEYLGGKENGIEKLLEKFKYSGDFQSNMKSLYDELKKEEKYFEPDAPTNFTVGFYTEGDRAKGLSIAAKYGSVIGKPPIKPGTGFSLIISRTQLLALKNADIKFFPTYDKCFVIRGK